MTKDEQKIEEVIAKMDGIKSRTVAEEIELYCSWEIGNGQRETDLKTKSLVERMWTALGAKKDDLVFEVGDFDSMGVEEAKERVKGTTGFWTWVGEEMTLIWKDGQKLVDLTCSRGCWSMEFKGKLFWEAKEGGRWTEPWTD